MDGYAFEFQGKTFTPDGRADEITNTDAHNRETEQREIEWLKTGPERVFLYIKKIRNIDDGYIYYDIGTWLGTVVGTHVSVGPRRAIGFGFHTYRRAVTCRIWGVLYHGWYMESSGDYCRLRKAKRQ